LNEDEVHWQARTFVALSHQMRFLTKFWSRSGENLSMYVLCVQSKNGKWCRWNSYTVVDERTSA